MSRRRAFVVGAASGIGAATADRFEQDGLDVVRADLPRNDWPEKEDRLRVDVRDEESVQSAVARATELLGGLDVVVNCAGVLGTVESALDMSAEEFDRVVAINLRGAFLLSRATIPALLDSEAGRLVHVASIAGKEGNPQMPAYSASKAGLIGLVKSVAKEFAATRLTVNAIAPATIETPLVNGMSAARREVQRELIPMGRFGLPREAAALIAFIASPEAGFTTGFAYDLSGGRADY